MYADTQQLVRIVRWAAQQPRLKRLHLVSSEARAIGEDDMVQVLEAQRSRPDLHIDPRIDSCSLDDIFD